MFALNPRRRVTLALVAVALFLFSASVAGEVAKHAMGARRLPGLNTFHSLFYIDAECNIASWYSTCALLLCSLLAGFIAAASQQLGIPRHRHFAAISTLFLLMSLDETVGIHERVMFPLIRAFRPTGVFRHAWVIVGIPIVLVVGMAFVPFLLSLPRRIAAHLVAAGAVFVSGALGMEMVGGLVLETSRWDGPTYQASIHIEEFMEMLGVIMFLNSFFNYMEISGLRLGVSRPPAGGDDRHPPGGARRGPDAR